MANVKILHLTVGPAVDLQAEQVWPAVVPNAVHHSLAFGY
jgi:hypothetical protein